MDRRLTLASLSLLACGRSQPAAAPRLLVARGGGLAVPISVNLPASWIVRAERELAPPDTDGVTMTFWATCEGDCTRDKLAARLAALVEAAPGQATRPNLNTGDDALDAVRLDVKTLEKGELPGGGFVAYHIRKPVGVDGPYFQGLAAVCARHQVGADAFVVATVRVQAEQEQAFGSQLLDACKTYEIPSR